MRKTFTTLASLLVWGLIATQAQTKKIPPPPRKVDVIEKVPSPPPERIDVKVKVPPPPKVNTKSSGSKSIPSPTKNKKLPPPPPPPPKKESELI